MSRQIMSSMSRCAVKRRMKLSRRLMNGFRDRRQPAIATSVIPAQPNRRNPGPCAETLVESLEPNLVGRDDERCHERAKKQKVGACNQLERKRRCSVCDGDGAGSAHIRMLAGKYAQTV